MDRDILDTKEAAEYLGISLQLLRKLIKQGEIPVKRVGDRHWRFSKRQLQEWIEQKETADDRENDD